MLRSVLSNPAPGTERQVGGELVFPPERDKTSFNHVTYRFLSSPAQHWPCASATEVETLLVPTPCCPSRSKSEASWTVGEEKSKR